ncbi:unnamed protein product, partial [Prorocentrum cordatum]
EASEAMTAMSGSFSAAAESDANAQLSSPPRGAGGLQLKIAGVLSRGAAHMTPSPRAVSSAPAPWQWLQSLLEELATQRGGLLPPAPLRTAFCGSA